MQEQGKGNNMAQWDGRLAFTISICVLKSKLGNESLWEVSKQNRNKGDFPLNPRSEFVSGHDPKVKSGP